MGLRIRLSSPDRPIPGDTLRNAVQLTAAVGDQRLVTEVGPASIDDDNILRPNSQAALSLQCLHKSCQVSVQGAVVCVRVHPEQTVFAVNNQPKVSLGARLKFLRCEAHVTYFQCQ